MINIKSKRILSILDNNTFDDSFIIRLLLNNYSGNKYDEIHKKILKLKINYRNSDNWFEVENDLINYFNKSSFAK